MSAGTDRRAQFDQALDTRLIDPAGPMNKYQLKEFIRLADTIGVRISVAASGSEDDTRASYDTDPDQGANAAIIHSAGDAAPGAFGNNLRIAYANTAVAGSETVAYSVTKAGVITVTVGIQTGVSTATQVLTALTTDAGTLLSSALKAGNSGAGAVVTMTAKALTGGDAPTGAFLISPSA